MVKTLITKFEENDRGIFWVLILFFGVAVMLYLYFLSVSVSAVISRKSAEQGIGAITSKISQLETTYVALDRLIDPALARERGFIDITVPKYITQDTNKNTTLTLRDEGGMR